MYAAKIYKEGRIMDVKHYEHFQNALADIGSRDIFDNLPSELLDGLWNPSIRYFSRSDDGIADDFEFRYMNGITVTLGEISPVDIKNNSKNFPETT